MGALKTLQHCCKSTEDTKSASQLHALPRRQRISPKAFWIQADHVTLLGVWDQGMNPWWDERWGCKKGNRTERMNHGV